MRLEDLIGQRIAACRGSKMTQAELGERIGAYLGKPWSRQTVSAAEKGGRAFTAMELLVLALVLDVPLAYLFADAEAAEDEARDVETPGGQSVPIDQVFRHLAPEHGEVDSLRARVAELEKLLDRHMQTKATGTPYPEFMADYLNSSMPTERKLEMAKLGSTTVGQIRAKLDAFAHPETDTERWIRKNPDTADGVGFPIDAYETELAAGRRAHAALLAVLDATDPAQLPPNGCGGDGCLAEWVRHVIAVALGIEADDG